MSKKILSFAIFFVASVGILNLAFPIARYIRNFPNLSRTHVVLSFLSLIFTTTLLAAVAFPFCVLGNSARWFRVLRATVLYFALVSMFAIACSGLGFGLSLYDLPFLGLLSFFFMEWEWLRFIFETALPLTACAGILYYVAAGQVMRKESSVR